MQERNIMLSVKRFAAVSLLSVTLIAPAGCDTTSGAITGAGAGAAIGAIADRRNPLVGALIGAGVGAIAGGIVGRINEEQKQKLQQESPQTWQTIQHNDKVASASPQPQPSNPGAAAPAQAPPAGNPVASNSPPANSAAPADDAPTPLSTTDVKNMASAGIKEDVICDEITQSKATYTAQDIAAAQQASPALDPNVIACMKQHMIS
jgi:hypothetical protein